MGSASEPEQENAIVRLSRERSFDVPSLLIFHFSSKQWLQSGIVATGSLRRRSSRLPRARQMVEITTLYRTVEACS